MRILLIVASAFLFVSFKELSKKESLLEICRQYFPENYVLLEEYQEVFVNHLAKGDSLGDYIFGLTTIMHEAYHVYEFHHNPATDSIRSFRLNDTLSVAVTKFKSFPCIELNNVVSAKDQSGIFRYNTYINNKDISHDSQQNGFLGLLGEFVAYYQEFKTYNAMFGFLKEHYAWRNAELWRRYLCEISSVKYSLYEFRLFVSWYLQYAKARHPEIYQRIITDRQIQKLYTHITGENESMIRQVEINRREIVSNLGQKIKIHNDFLTVVENGNSNGLHDIQMQQTISLLSAPEHLILKKLEIKPQ